MLKTVGHKSTDIVLNIPYAKIEERIMAIAAADHPAIIKKLLNNEPLTPEEQGILDKIGSLNAGQF